MTVSIEIAAQRNLPVPALSRDGNCWSLLYTLQESYGRMMRVRRCPATGLWSQSLERRLVELAPDLRTVRYSDEAARHTVLGETNYTPPPGALALRAVAETFGLHLTEWSHPAGRRFALHSERGNLIAAEVRGPSSGSLLGPGSPLVFVDDWARPRMLTEARGRIVWRPTAR